MPHPIDTRYITSGLTESRDRYAEMDQKEKNKISHRYRALKKLRIWIEDGMKE